MLPGPMHFTLRGIPTPPVEREERKCNERCTSASGILPPDTPDSAGKTHHGWIDMLLGDTSLDDLFRDED
mgnify:CR=1 FL=1